MIELARRYGRYGYRRIAALLRDAGWQVNDKRVDRLWRCEGLKVPGKQPKRGRLWLNDGSCIQLRAEWANHVWSYDFVHHRTYDGRAFRMLNVLDEFTRESLAIRVGRKLSSSDVIDVLTDLFILRGIPARIRSDNGPVRTPRRCTSTIRNDPWRPDTHIRKTPNLPRSMGALRAAEMASASTVRVWGGSITPSSQSRAEP